jgi:hypothetical protein
MRIAGARLFPFCAAFSVSVDVLKLEAPRDHGVNAADLLTFRTERGNAVEEAGRAAVDAPPEDDVLGRPR